MTFIRNIFPGARFIILYGLLMAMLVFVLKWLEWKFLIVDNATNIYAGLIAVLFTALGCWTALQLVKPKMQTLIVEKEVYVAETSEAAIDKAELKKLNLSDREYQVLQLLANGHSNAAIAEEMFLTVSTVKTHISNLFVKMDVKSRTQAIAKAKKLKIIF